MERSLKVSNILIVFAIISFVVMLFLANANRSTVGAQVLLLSSIIFQIIFGSIVLGVSVGITKKTAHFFIALILLGYGFTTLLLFTCLPFSFGQIWPSFSLYTGLSIMGSSLFKFKKIKFGYGFSGLFFTLMGVLYGLFSFNIIKFSFKDVARIGGPILLLITIIGMIVFFLLQQKHKELVLKDEDLGVFSEEDDNLI